MKIRIWDFVNERYVKNAEFIHLEVDEKTEDEYHLVSQNLATIELCSGCKDCNGYDIFENDIVYDFGLDIYQIVKFSKEKARFEIHNFDIHDSRYGVRTFADYHYGTKHLKIIGSYNDHNTLAEVKLAILTKYHQKEKEDLIA